MNTKSKDREQSRPRIRSFVLRTGRLTAAQSTAIEQHWPLYGLDVSDTQLDTELTFDRLAPLTLEIGFGMGDSLLAMAETMPERNFIGIEVHTPGVGSLLAGVHEKSLSNLKVYHEDAVKVLESCFPDNSIDCVQIFFPDPWQKKRHHKRRLIQKPFLDFLATKLKPQAQLHIATDWQNYAEHCLELLQSEPNWRNAAEDGGYSARPASRPTTKFERRGEGLGHGVWDLIFELV